MLCLNSALKQNRIIVQNCNANNKTVADFHKKVYISKKGVKINESSIDRRTLGARIE